MSTIGIKVRRARQKKGISQLELSTKTGICRASIMKLEDGTHIPRFDRMLLVIKALGLPLEKMARAV